MPPSKRKRNPICLFSLTFQRESVTLVASRSSLCLWGGSAVCGDSEDMDMTGGDRTFLSHSDDSTRVTSFARHVLGEVNLRPSQTKTTRRDAFASWLAEIVVSFGPYDQAVVLDSLDQARLTADDLILFCVPQAANILGQRWTCSELGFASVSLGSARLHGLCHTLGSEWIKDPAIEGGKSILLATIEIEDHMIGASVLAYRLRRSGHSVRVETKATADDLVRLIDVGWFDGVMLSCSSVHSIESISAAIKDIHHRACVQTPIILGGPILHEVDGIKERTGVALATNDINAALSLIGHGQEIALPKVAE